MTKRPLLAPTVLFILFMQVTGQVGQLADTSTRGLDKSRTGQLAVTDCVDIK